MIVKLISTIKRQQNRRADIFLFSLRPVTFISLSLSLSLSLWGGRDGEHKVTDLPIVSNIPDTDLSIVAASDDMLHVRGHQYGRDTVCGCMAPPQHHRNHYTAAACHLPSVSKGSAPPALSFPTLCIPVLSQTVRPDMRSVILVTPL